MRAITTTVLGTRLISSGVVARIRTFGFAATIHSVFAQAVNLLAEDEIVTLALPSVGAPPNGVVLDADCSLLCLGLRPGMAVVGNRGHLLVPEAGLTVDFEAPIWPAGLANKYSLTFPGPLARNMEMALDLSASRVAAQGFGAFIPAVGSLRGLLGRVAGAAEELLGSASIQPSVAVRPRSLSEAPAVYGPSSPSYARSFEAAVSVARGMRSHDLRTAIVAAEEIIGFGPGLTPSGDDFLVGFCAVLAALNYPGAFSLASACAEKARGRTTVVAESFLRCAARGEFSERLHGLIDALLVGDSARAYRGVESALDWGASSGADSLFGVLMGFGTAKFSDLRNMCE